MDLIISSIVGGIIGLIVGIIFEDPLTRFKNRLIKYAQAIFYRTQLTPHAPQTFSLGNFHTAWLVIDGDGEMTYTPTALNCTIDNTPASLPPEIIELRNKIEIRETDKKNQGLPYMWNGPLYALDRFAVGRTIPDEHMEVVFTFRPTDYYTFQATVMSLDENLVQHPAIMTLRQKYLQNCDLSIPIPFLANGFGVVLVVITKDKKLILPYRSDSSGARAGELDVSVVEAVHPVIDRSIIHRGPDLYRTAIRGAKEEVGIELIQEEITFLGFGVDIEYYQWGIIGVGRIFETAHNALANRQRGTVGKWEMKQFEIVDADPYVVFNHLKQKKIWSVGLVAIYWTLVNEYGKKRVDSAVKKVFG